jgi:hypothetical protein
MIVEAMGALGGQEAEIFSIRDPRQLIQLVDQTLDNNLLNIKGKTPSSHA